LRVQIAVDRRKRVKSDFLLAFNQVCSDRGLPRDVVLEALEAALVSAYGRSVDSESTDNVTAKIDLETGAAHIFVEKQVVEEVANPNLELSLPQARELQPNIQLGEAVVIDDTPKDFGRIAAQNAKQIILQRIREAERDARYAHYIQQEGEIVHGTVQSIKPHAVSLHLEGTEAILPRSQQVPGERYTLHQRIRAYVLEVRKTSRGPQIVVSRSHKNMLRRLLELEVPEIFSGAVEIKSISREAGSRSKVAVAARQPGVDPVGACVGMRGVRIQSIVNELGGEKIDVIEWNPDASTFIAKALSPAKVLSVQLEEDPAEGKTANVVVPDDQLSLAIGRAGQNARLAAKLTAWRIDIQGVTEAATKALQQVNEDPNVLPALGPVAELLPVIAGILRQHEEAQFPYNSEELLTIRQVIEGVDRYYASLRNAERMRRMAEETARRAAIEAAEAERRASVEAALALIPPQADEIPLADTGISERVLNHLRRAEVTTVGDVMRHLAEGDEGLLKLDGIGPKSLAEVKEYLDTLTLIKVEAEATETVAAEAETSVSAGEDAAAVEAVAVKVEAVSQEPVAAADVEAVEEMAEALPEVAVEAESVAEEVAATETVATETVATEAAVTEAAGEEAAVLEVTTAESSDTQAVVTEPAATETVGEEPAVVERISPPLFEEEFEEEEGEVGQDGERSRKRDRRRRRELVYDEELGAVVAVRRRKREQDDEWGNY
jgi:N utilization substance protein A